MPKAGERLGITHQEKLPFPKHLMTQDYRRAIQKNHIHLVRTKGVAGRLDIIDERASFSVGS